MRRDAKSAIPPGLHPPDRTRRNNANRPQRGGFAFWGSAIRTRISTAAGALAARPPRQCVQGSWGSGRFHAIARSQGGILMTIAAIIRKTATAVLSRDPGDLAAAQEIRVLAPDAAAAVRGGMPRPDPEFHENNGDENDEGNEDNEDDEDNERNEGDENDEGDEANEDDEDNENDEGDEDNERDEGDERNEGNEGNEDNEGDETFGPLRDNDGDEGEEGNEDNESDENDEFNEGDEGNEDDEGDEFDEKDEFELSVAEAEAELKMIVAEGERGHGQSDAPPFRTRSDGAPQDDTFEVPRKAQRRSKPDSVYLLVLAGEGARRWRARSPIQHSP